MIRVLGDKRPDQAVHDPDERAADDHDEELGEAGHEIHDLQVSLADLREPVHHVVQNLEEGDGEGGNRVNEK